MTPIEKKTGTFKSFDGTKIYYEVRGEGPPLVFVYGIGCLINHWRFQIKHFSENYQTITFDFRAHHKSDIPENPDSIGIDPIVEDIVELLKHLDVPQATFLGHSFGVQVLIRLMERHPELATQLIFINGFANDPITPMFGNGFVKHLFNGICHVHQWLPETTAYAWRILTNNPIATQLSGLAGGFNLNLTQLKDIEIYARGIGSLELTSYLKLFEDMIRYDGRSSFEKIHVPTLIISGKKDSVTPQSYQEEMHQRIVSSQYMSVPYGSHCTQLDMPEYVNLLIEKFLSEN